MATSATAERVGGAIDPRLARHAASTRRFVRLTVALGSLAGLLIVAQAWLIAHVVADAFHGGRTLAALRGAMAALLVVVVARALVAWGGELAAAACSARAKSEIRRELLAPVAADGTGAKRSGELAVLASRGIDALDGYFSLYLPQLFLGVIVPLLVVAAVLWSDWISGLILILTIPLVPLFMVLVGATTRERMDRQLRTLERLAGHYLDVLAGLQTLLIFGRAKAQLAAVRSVSERYRSATLDTLRISFLSSLILELVAAVSVALVAVAIGIRLLDGQLAFATGLFALVLAPEAYLPLRRLGANYHASAEGVAAAAEAFAVIEAPRRARGADREIPDPARQPIAVEKLSVSYPGRREPALDRLSLVVEPGSLTALVGPSGCGKSTLLAVLLGLQAPYAGRVTIGGSELAALDLEAWRARLAWVPQRPHLFRGSIAENVRVARADASDEEVLAALEAAGLAAVVASRPAGIETALGGRGAGLSAGERQRVALARAFLRDAPLLLLDEPTAGLDAASERIVLDAVSRLASGRTALVVAHRPALVALADRVIELPAAGERR